MEDPVALHVESFGTGRNLILSHGFGGSARNFRPQARALAERARSTLYDTRGHARSAAPEGSAAYTEAALISDFARVVAAQGGDAVVGGLSLGAYTALRYALQAEPRPRALLLAAFPSGGSDGVRTLWAREFAAAIDAEGLERAGERFVWGETARFDAKGAALIRQGLLEHPAFALSALLRNVLSQLQTPDQLSEQLRALDVPVSIIVGDQDADSMAPSRRLAELLPQSELVIVPGAGHVVNLAAPAPFNQSLGRLLDRAG